MWPENTLLSFQGAYDLGFRHFETDLHCTSDEVVVCFHDPVVDRTTDGSGPVSAHTHDELMRLNAGHNHLDGGEFPFRDHDLSVPSLEELLTTFPDVSVVVDLKSDGVEAPLVDVLSRLDAWERLIVGSFSDDRLARFRKLSEGRVPISAGPRVARRWLMRSRLRRSGGGEISALQIPLTSKGIRVVDRLLIETAQHFDVAVHVWTVNRIEEMEHLLEMGVDGLITDRPDLLRQVLVDRGQWPN